MANENITAESANQAGSAWHSRVENVRATLRSYARISYTWGRGIKRREAVELLDAVMRERLGLLGALDLAVELLDQAPAEHDLAVARLEVALAGANNEIQALTYHGTAHCRCSTVPVTIDGRDLGGIVMMQAEDHIAERELARVTAVERDVERSKRHQAERDRIAAAADLRTARKEANRLAADLIRARQATRDLEAELEAELEQVRARGADHLRETRAELGRERRSRARLVEAALGVLPAVGEPENQRPTRAAMRELRDAAGAGEVASVTWAEAAEALKDSPIGAMYFGNAEIPTNTDGSVTFNIIPSVGVYRPGPGDQSPVNGC